MTLTLFLPSNSLGTGSTACSICASGSYTNAAGMLLIMCCVPSSVASCTLMIEVCAEVYLCVYASGYTVC